LRALVTCLRAFKTLLIRRVKKHMKSSSSYLLMPSNTSHNALQSTLHFGEGMNRTSTANSIIKESNLHNKIQEAVTFQGKEILTERKRKSSSSKTRHSLL